LPPEYYGRLVAVIQLVLPFFADFVLEPIADQKIYLRWRERGSDVVFGAHQLSDGTLRFMMLATLLLLPPSELPNLIIIDEPELGLHPAAIQILVNLVHGVLDYSQVILTTQSTALLDLFEPEEIVVADRTREPSSTRYETTFKRLDGQALKDWLADYYLSELWEKGVLGGGPLA
jgi:predicted ATPase